MAPLDGSVRACTTCLAVFRMDYERCPLDGGEIVLHLGDPLIGCTVADKYVIEELIGEGAMSRVYRARHRHLPNLRYAVKVLLGDLAASATMRARFGREAENASRLEHPNVVNVIDFGRSAMGLHYLVMDYVQGVTLTAIIKDGPMPAERVIRIAHQLCEGLEHAHGRGVIHRDFKCDNILIVGDAGREVARIADFGLAWSTGQASARLTSTGVACTPAYAAPEQLRGVGFDHRVDLYALGVTLFEMLSGGYLPFEGDINQTVRAKLASEAPSVMTRAPHVPPGLVTLVSRLLASDPNERPRSARAVIRALETSMTLPRPPIRTVDMRPLAKPRRRGGAAATVVTLMLAAGLGSATQYDEHVAMPVSYGESAIDDYADGFDEVDRASMAMSSSAPSEPEVVAAQPIVNPPPIVNAPPIADLPDPAALALAEPTPAAAVNIPAATADVAEPIAKPVVKAAAKKTPRRSVRTKHVPKPEGTPIDDVIQLEHIEQPAEQPPAAAPTPAPIEPMPAAAPAPAPAEEQQAPQPIQPVPAAAPARVIDQLR